MAKRIDPKKAVEYGRVRMVFSKMSYCDEGRYRIKNYILKIENTYKKDDAFQASKAALDAIWGRKDL